MTTRRCPKCDMFKSTDEFSGNYTYCKPCATARVKAAYWRTTPSLPSCHETQSIDC